MTEAVDSFILYRPMLIGIAYRIVGSMWDAEDIVQDAYVKWTKEPRDEVRDVKAFLVTSVSRLALDMLKSARKQREVYTGPWLPEPALSQRLGPLDTVELRETVSFATLHLMERLSPAERAVFILHGAFKMPFIEVGEVIALSAANCRQIYHRALRHIQGDRRFWPNVSDHSALLGRFLEAAQGNDFEELGRILADEVRVWNDGGGAVRAALRVISGRDRALAFFAGLLAKMTLGDVTMVDANGEGSALLRLGDAWSFVSIAEHDGLITDVYALLNPAKLQAFAIQDR